MSNPFNPAIHNGLSVIHKILDNDKYTEGGYRVFYNVNFPPTEIIKGAKLSCAPRIEAEYKFWSKSI